jgi:ArsR family transcriptional regulator
MQGIDASVELLNVLGDPTRVRLLHMLGREELTVAELTAVTGLAQSRVSTHLGRLRDAGLVRDRRVGASTYYTLAEGAMPEGARRLWELVSAELSDPVLEGDRERAEALVRSRDAESWPEAIAGQMERHYSPGRTWEATVRGLLGFAVLGDVLDVGAGDGVMAQLVASRARSVTCVDRSERVIAAARARIGERPSVRFVVADMHELPFAKPCFDQAMLFNVLTYSHAPGRAVAEAARVLRPGGRLAVVTLDAHAHAAITAAYSHVNAGFSPGALRELLEHAGLCVEHCELSSRERRSPNFGVVTAFADKPATTEIAA